jgi:hypothetical protein
MVVSEAISEATLGVLVAFLGGVGSGMAFISATVR